MPKKLEGKQLSKTKITKAKLALVLRSTGLAFLSLGGQLFLLLFAQVIAVELLYYVNKPDANAKVRLTWEDTTESNTEAGSENSIIPADKDFSLIIPKIGANAKVNPDVDPFRKSEYMASLRSGVAHAEGTRYPGQLGNTFLFAHSAANFYEASNLNVKFYLLGKLDAGDKVYVVYQERLYTYEVVEKKVVSPDDVQYLTNPPGHEPDQSYLTLMTCTPAGTPIHRLILTAKLVS